MVPSTNGADSGDILFCAKVLQRINKVNVARRLSLARMIAIRESRGFDFSLLAVKCLSTLTRKCDQIFSSELTINYLNDSILIFLHSIFLLTLFCHRELQRIESCSSAPVISHFSETILGLTTIRAYNQESRFMEILFKRMEANNVAFVILNSSNRWLGIALVRLLLV